MDTAIITFVIPVKDRANYLREALVSLQSQTVPLWKCIVVDDNSVENIKEVVDNLNDERILYTKNTKTPGVSGARNTGNELATTEWIALADSDDINLPRRLEVSLSKIKTNPQADVIYGNLYTFRQETYEINQWKYSEPYLRENLYNHNFIANNTAMYRRGKVLEIGGYNENLESAEDYDMWLKFSDVHANFVYIDEPLALYRRHGDQFTAIDGGREKMRANARKVVESHASFL